MTLRNPDNIAIVDAFIRLYGEAAAEIAPYPRDIVFLELPESENEYRDPVARLGDKIYVSERELGLLGLSEGEILAVLAHELGHIVRRTDPFMPDAETRADALAADLGLGRQMIRVLERLIESRRYPRLTSQLVERIHQLQHISA